MPDMPDILKKICSVKREEIRALKKHGRGPLQEMIAGQSPPRGFRNALKVPGSVSLIAEVKRASPSAGVIREDSDSAAVARAYARGGARCISVLTDRQFFGGSLDDLSRVRSAVKLPVLRKDFILEEIQLLEARAWGADCVLLIVAALEAQSLASLLQACCELGMDALVEVHTEKELATAIEAGATLIGVNNRDLHTFEVDLAVSERLARRIPEDVVKVSESGIRGREDVARLKSWGYDAVLVGEFLMRQEDVAAATKDLTGV